jgi:glycosyltransferase involved in cell wall biosynthesis
MDSNQFHDLDESRPPVMRCSIIIPTYNRATYLDVAINSVLSQMMPGDELIVVDDGSEDETPAVLRKYGTRITAMQGGHGGAGRARNLGIERAGNDLVAFLDSDDRWFPHKLRIQRDFMARRLDVLFSFTKFEVQFRDGSVQPRYLELWHRDHATWEEVFGPGLMYSAVAPLPEGIPDFPVYEGDLYRPQLTGFYVLTDTLVARRKEAGDALHFAEDLKTYEDLECFYRLSQRGKAAFLDLETVRQLDHPHDRLSQLASIDKIDARLTLMRRFWGADPAFLQQHSSLYRRSHDELLLQKAGLLLSQGTNRMAKRTLAEMSSPPAFLRLLSHLPGWLTARALEVRRRSRDH